MEGGGSNGCQHTAHDSLCLHCIFTHLSLLCLSLSCRPSPPSLLLSAFLQQEAVKEKSFDDMVSKYRRKLEGSAQTDKTRRWFDE